MTSSSHKSGEEITDTIYVKWRCPSTGGEKLPMAFIPRVEGQQFGVIMSLLLLKACII